MNSNDGNAGNNLPLAGRFNLVNYLSPLGGKRQCSD
jgi:hypothetical protein